ncbi:hypothetical protein BHE74_00026313 [Ensete ventricosum]|nr:hypothetical protein BHE74_00026313 [Ensete ventricosum]
MGEEKFGSSRNRPQPITTTWKAATNQSDTSVRTLKAMIVVNVDNAFRKGFRFRDEQQRQGPPQASTLGPPLGSTVRARRWAVAAAIDDVGTQGVCYREPSPRAQLATDIGKDDPTNGIPTALIFYFRSEQGPPTPNVTLIGVTDEKRNTYKNSVAVLLNKARGVG